MNLWMNWANTHLIGRFYCIEPTDTDYTVQLIYRSQTRHLLKKVINMSNHPGFTDLSACSYLKII